MRATHHRWRAHAMPQFPRQSEGSQPPTAAAVSGCCLFAQYANNVWSAPQGPSGGAEWEGSKVIIQTRGECAEPRSGAVFDWQNGVTVVVQARC